MRIDTKKTGVSEPLNNSKVHEEIVLCAKEHEEKNWKIRNKNSEEWIVFIARRTGSERLQLFQNAHDH